MREPDFTLECDDDNYGRLTINSVLMHNEAWCLPDLSSLWSTPSVRGRNAIISGATGVLSKPLRSTETRHSLPFLVSGQHDHLGNVYTDPEKGLEANLAYLWTHVLSPVTTGRGTRKALLTLPSGAERVVDVQVLGTGPTRLLPKGFMRTTLELIDPDGGLRIGS